MNWVKTGFGPNFLEYHSTLPYYMDYNAARQSTTPVSDLIKQAIQRIVDQYPAPYTLICSGGVDSQSMILAWIQSGFPFEVVTARYNDGMNDYDLENLWQLQARENFPIRVLDLDILSFHENQLNEWAAKYDCTSPHIVTHMFICSHITCGTVISSGNFVTKDGRIGAHNYLTFGLYRYAMKSGQPVVSHFWTHDQDLMPAFEPIRQLLGKSGPPEYLDKCKILQVAGLNVIPQSEKYNGFEQIKNYYDTRSIGYKDRVYAAGQLSTRNYDILFRYKLEKYARKVSYNGVTLFDYGVHVPP